MLSKIIKSYKNINHKLFFFAFNNGLGANNIHDIARVLAWEST